MLKAFFTAVVVLIAAILIFTATRPDTFRVERSASVNAPPEKIFPLLNDFHQWKAWSPWEKVDPAAKTTFSGANEGVGAVYEWNGNKEIGKGRIEIIESVPPSKLVLRIDFIKPFEGHNTIEFILAPQGEATIVTQAMYGQNTFLSKIMGLFFSMDKMVGSKYEEGLTNLKTIAEQ